MSSSQIERKLAAIMFTDIAGYTEQMSTDQHLAFSLLETKQKTLRPLIKKHNGTLIKEMGDGTLSHFPSAIDASNCSLDLQKSIKDNSKLNVRIGIHLGDTIFKDDDIFGDGVNIASRLESMSPPGGIFVSKNVFDELTSIKGYEGISLGLQSLKGVGRLVEVFALKDKHLTIPDPEDYKSQAVSVHKDKDVPSVAIIPLKNKGKDEDVFYAYGISADIIKDCSRGRLIRVESLDNIEKIENYDKLTSKEIAKKLSVRYVVNGSLWKMEELFQLTIELYDTKHSKVIWSDRWQENWENLVNIKKNLSDALLATFNSSSIIKSESETLHVEAYKKYLEAKYKLDILKSIDSLNEALILLKSAIELDSEFVEAYSSAASCMQKLGDNQAALNYLEIGMNIAKSTKNNPGLIHILNIMGQVNFYMGKYKVAEKNYLEALSIGKNIYGDSSDNIFIEAKIRTNYSLTLLKLNDPEQALKQNKIALRIKEDLGETRSIGNSYGQMTNTYHSLGRYSQALVFADKALESFKKNEQNNFICRILVIISEIYEELGLYDKLQSTLAQAEPIALSFEDNLLLGKIYFLHGLNYCHLESFDEAQNSFDKSITCYSQLDKNNLKLSSLVEKLKICVELNDHGEAQSLLNIIHKYSDCFSEIEFSLTYESLKLLVEARLTKLDKKSLNEIGELKNTMLDAQGRDGMYSNWYLCRVYAYFKDKKNSTLHHNRSTECLNNMAILNKNDNHIDSFIHKNYYHKLIKEQIIL